MIWLTWRQQRTETLLAAALVALLAAVLVPTGLHVATIYDRDGIAACLGHQSSGCANAFVAFNNSTQSMSVLTGWIKFVPGVLAILLAAPFVAELEQGTFRLAWTQSITRRRWLLTKLGLITLAALTTGLILTALLTWWRNPLDHFHGRLDPDGFDLEGTVPLAYMLFAVGCVTAAGAFVRRTLPAIGIGLVSFVAARLCIAAWLRPHYLHPLSATWSPTQTGPELRSQWVLSQAQTDAHGHPLTNAVSIVQDCTQGLPARLATGSCLQQHGLYLHAVYQPAGRFWAFQGIETGIFVVLGLTLLGLAGWWTHHASS